MRSQLNISGSSHVGVPGGTLCGRELFWWWRLVANTVCIGKIEFWKTVPGWQKHRDSFLEKDCRLA